MTSLKEIESLIDSKIRLHEFRVALISGIVGGVVIAGIFHAIRISYVAATGGPLCHGVE
jgi:hypothetical protein